MQSKKSKINTTSHEEWIIIPCPLDDMFMCVNSLNKQVTMAPVAESLQLLVYMSYLKTYNKQMYNILPDD